LTVTSRQRRIIINVAVSPVMVQVQRSRLVGLIVAAVALGAGLALAVSLGTDARSDKAEPVVEIVARDVSSAEAVLADLSPDARDYVEGIMAMTHAELVAAFGTGPFDSSPPTTRDVSSAEAVLADLSPDARDYVEGIMAMTHAELVAAFGTGPFDLSSPTTRGVSPTEEGS
jgi:hypothetical protein